MTSKTKCEMKSETKSLKNAEKLSPVQLPKSFSPALFHRPQVVGA